VIFQDRQQPTVEHGERVIERINWHFAVLLLAWDGLATLASRIASDCLT
jgi:hypothetical protein